MESSQTESVRKEVVNGVETWHLAGTQIHNSVGCKHYFIQKSHGKAECRECGLGVFGYVATGKLLKHVV